MTTEEPPSPRLYRLAGLRQYEELITHASLHPADATYADGYGDTTLHRLCRLPDPPHEALRAILTVYPEAATVLNSANWTPLQFALWCGTFSDESLLLLIAAAPEAVGWEASNGWTPFHRAVDAGSSLVVLRGMLGAVPKVVRRTTKRGVGPLHLLWDSMSDRHKLGDQNGVVPANRDEAQTMSFPDHHANKPASESGLTLLRAKMNLLLRVLHHGTVDDPLPDGAKFRVLHAACGAGRSCPRDYVQLILKWHRDEASEQDERGNLPLVYALRNADPVAQAYTKFIVEQLLQLYPRAAAVPDEGGRLPLHIALQNQLTWEKGGIDLLVLAYPEALRMRDGTNGLYPMMEAAAFARRGMGGLNMVYELLIACPEVVGTGYIGG